jgi:hypothetical protein
MASNQLPIADKTPLKPGKEKLYKPEVLCTAQEKSRIINDLLIDLNKRDKQLKPIRGNYFSQISLIDGYLWSAFIPNIL